MTRVLLVVLISAALGAAFFRWRVRRRVTPVAPTDPLWEAAIARARATASLMEELYRAGKEVWVKFPVRMNEGDVEHVWGRVKSISPEWLRATVETPALNHRGQSESEVAFPLSVLEDWQVELPDGSIRGGFGTRAQAEIARRDGLPVPRHVREMLPRFVDA